MAKLYALAISQVHDDKNTIDATRFITGLNVASREGWETAGGLAVGCGKLWQLLVREETAEEEAARMMVGMMEGGEG